jgi:uncharacterized protein YndB with AHSA1/START domain
MKQITVKNRVRASAEKVWDLWTSPEHIVQWNSPSPDWHSPRAENDIRPGGRFNIRMEARDGSFGFDFEGTYDEVIPHKRIAYTLGDGRKVEISFTENGKETGIVETFDPENQNPIEMQREGWQAILDNFKAYAENN